MKTETIKQVLMRRDGMSAERADELIEEAKDVLRCRLEDAETYGDPSEICYDYFGLEDDYIYELL